MLRDNKVEKGFTQEHRKDDNLNPFFCKGFEVTKEGVCLPFLLTLRSSLTSKVKGVIEMMTQ